MGANVPVEDGLPYLMPVHPNETLIGAEGACVGAPRDWFFSALAGGMNQGVRVCKTECSVMAECREFGDYLERNSTHKGYVFGVWGGERPAERIRRRKAVKLRRAA